MSVGLIANVVLPRTEVWQAAAAAPAAGQVAGLAAQTAVRSSNPEVARRAVGHVIQVVRQTPAGRDALPRVRAGARVWELAAEEVERLLRDAPETSPMQAASAIVEAAGAAVVRSAPAAEQAAARAQLSELSAVLREWLPRQP